MIKTALKYFGFSLIFWMVFFNTGRLFFLIYNTHDTLLSSHISSIFYHAFRLDLASAFYLILPLFVFWILSLFTPLSNMDRALKLYFILLIPILSFITIVDLEIYRLWGVKLNAQALSYLRYPTEVLASSESSPLVFLLLLWGGLSALFIWLSELVVNRIKNSLELASGLSPRSIFRNGVMGFAGIIILVIGLRGGIQLAPVNQSFAYFSD